MSRLKKKLKNFVITENEKYSVLSVVFIVIIGISKGSLSYIKEGLNARKHNKAVLPLMDIDVLNERISYIKDLAGSDSSKKKFYVISRETYWGQGLFAYVTLYFMRVFYAIAEGMIPVIDMQSRQNLFLDEGEVGHVNAWEKFFKQPCGYGLDDVKDGKVIKSSGRQGLLHNYIFCEEETFSQHLKLWAALYENFFSVTDNASQYIEQEYMRVIKPGMRTIGVHFRGTDYSTMRLPGLPIQPEISDVINKVKDAMSLWGCDYVYISSEARKTVEQFENAFPGKVLTVSQCYYDEADVDFSKTFVGQVRFDRENDTYLKGLEYLSAIIILSRCTCAVLGACSGSAAALYINGGKYENVHIYNLGICP